MQPQYAICPNCGKEFQLQRWAIRQKQKFCSVRCGNIGRWANTTTEELFWRHVNKTDSCWLWTGGKSGGGYGLFTIMKPVQKSIVAHRYAWEIKYGPIKDDLILCHNCPGGDNPACVLWDHIFIGTHKDNTQDALKKGMMTIGEDSNLAKLTEKKVLEIRHLAAHGVPLKELAIRFGITRDGIYRIVARINWKHVLPKSEQMIML